jgi:hypothetical protein
LLCSVPNTEHTTIIYAILSRTSSAGFSFTILR